MAKAGTTMHPPTVSIGEGGPPAPKLADDTRAQRDKINDRLSAVRAERRSAPQEDREKFDQEIADLVGQQKKLSEQIRMEESGATRH